MLLPLGSSYRHPMIGAKVGIVCVNPTFLSRSVGRNLGFMRRYITLVVGWSSKGLCVDITVYTPSKGHGVSEWNVEPPLQSF